MNTPCHDSNHCCRLTIGFGSRRSIGSEGRADTHSYRIIACRRACRRASQKWGDSTARVLANSPTAMLPVCSFVHEIADGTRVQLCDSVPHFQRLSLSLPVSHWTVTGVHTDTGTGSPHSESLTAICVLRSLANCSS